MDVVGSEIGQKMRSAIKAKLTELGCYVDDELPDYVMVMVANKRTRAQMEDDLQLFLGDNTELFVNWLHQVLKKLQEVTVTAPLKAVEQEKGKERSTSKERKSKDKKDKDKSRKSDLKKAKKKEKEKLHRKKEEKKEKKSKKKSKHHDMIRPNIPPLLMNIEKESEPSITDVFAGQILKSHGITLESLKEEKRPKTEEEKVVVKESKRPILPIIDPATISSQPDPDAISLNSEATADNQERVRPASVTSQDAVKGDQLKEMNEIEAKILGLKHKLAEQLDSMSEDEDFLNIRTEAEELMNDFAEDVFQEISQQAPVSTPPLKVNKSPSPPKEVPKAGEISKSIETLPHIELNLPKRPVRERLGAREEPKKAPEVEERRIESPERFTPEPIPDLHTKTKSAKSRLSDPPGKTVSVSDEGSEKSESSLKRLTSKVSVLENRSRSCASVVRVRPRPRVSAPASSLLLRAVADAHKSQLNIPPKVDPGPQKVKRGIVLPMRRVGDPNIVIQVPAERTQTDSQDDNISLEMDSDEEKRVISELDRDEYVPKSLTMKIKNTDYVPSRRNEGRTTSRRDETLVIETINIHNPTVDKDKNTQFIVTMDGFNPNAFLTKKLMTEGLLNEEEDTSEKTKTKDNFQESAASIKPQESAVKDKTQEFSLGRDKESKTKERDTFEKSEDKPKEAPKKRISSESTESLTQVVIKQEKEDDNMLMSVDTKEISSKTAKSGEKRKSDTNSNKVGEKTPPAKKRRTPIVFDVDKKDKEVVKERERTESASSDNNVIVTTATNTHKYDALPPYSLDTMISMSKRSSLKNDKAYIKPTPISFSKLMRLAGENPQRLPLRVRNRVSVAERKPVWCRAFPMCRYGNSCAFQHPRCKFAAACTRRGCVYSHGPAPLSPTPSISSHVVPAANYKSITASALPSMCKYYPSCSNPVCTFFHPKACRYGAACLNKLECNFYHADLPASKWRYPA